MQLAVTIGLLGDCYLVNNRLFNYLQILVAYSYRYGVNAYRVHWEIKKVILDRFVMVLTKIVL